MDCTVCGERIPDGGTWCLHCGAPVQLSRGETGNAPSREEADRLCRDGLHREAIAMYTQLLETAATDGDKAGLYEAMGDACLAQGNLRQAVGIYRQAIQLQPSDALRRKYDAAIDRLHAAPAPAGPAKPAPARTARPRPTPPAPAAPALRITESPQADAADGLTGLDAWRQRVTPKVAALISAAAVMAVFAGAIFTSQPWVQPVTPPKKTQAIDAQRLQKRIPAPAAGAAAPAAGRQQPGALLHHSKTGGGVR